MKVSPFESKLANASKPVEEMLPLGITNLSPNNSDPLSIISFPFTSKAKKQSDSLIQAVFSSNPLLSRSKFTPFSRPVKNSSSLSVYLMISGSRCGACFSASLYSS
ncbi:MAG: hypothetical protein MR434_01010, partial [Ruminococcus sp.]|nr:hypothetical protein [Ruminococcus sp.]